MLKIVIERWFWEFKLLIGSLVELRAWLHSSLRFSLLEKLFLKASLTPGYLSSFQAFSYCNLDRSLIFGGSIEKVPGPSIASRHLVDRSSFYSWFWWVVPCYILNTLAVDGHFLTPSSTGVSIPLDTCICRDLLLTLFKLHVRSGFHFIRYLSWYFSVFSPKPFHLTPIFVP